MTQKRVKLNVMSQEMYDFIVANMHKIINIDVKNGMITTVKGTNGTLCSSTGYLKVRLNRRLLQVHQIMAVIYFGEKCVGMQVNHINGKEKTNNKRDNLEVCTQKENIQHQWNTGLANVEWSRKFTNEEVQYIRSIYKPKNREFGARALARKYKCNKNTIERIINRKTYKNVK